MLKTFGIQWLISRIAPMVIRYILFGIGAILTYLGFNDQTILSFNEQMQTALGILFSAGALIWASSGKTSVEANRIAKDIDQKASKELVKVHVETQKRLPKTSYIPSRSR